MHILPEGVFGVWRNLLKRQAVYGKSFQAILEETYLIQPIKTYKNTGHFETVKIIYDQSKISFERLLNLYWTNIDPFDAAGQFCDKGLSYRTVVFYQNNLQKQLIEKSIKNIEKKFNGKKVVTFVRKFEKFYPAENYHQDYYQENFINYLMYKKACGREEQLKRIWQ